MMAAQQLPLPQPVVDELRALGSPTARHLVAIQEHLAGGARGRIVLPWCEDCAKPHWYPSVLCPHCGSPNWSWRDMGTEATLHSWTVVSHPMAPALRGHVPVVVGLAAPCAAPSIRLVTALRAEPGTALRIGQTLEAVSGPTAVGGQLLTFAVRTTE